MSVTWNPAGEKALMTSRQWRQTLDSAAFVITAHAVPYSGVDTGRLTQSMGHSVEQDLPAGHLVARLGSGLGDGAMPVSYWSFHWADRPAPGQESMPVETAHLPHRPHPTKPAPTQPYSHAMRELGIQYQVEPGGYES